MKNDVIIIGGGAAGLSAALSASGQGARVTVLEGSPRVGRKILASGNGRCNLANTGPRSYPGNPAFASRVLDGCPVEAVLRFFHGLGLVTVQEEGGRVYPGCGQAAAVLDSLRGAAERRGIRVICESPAQKITPADGAWRVHTPQGVLEARAVVAAFGGMAGGKLGHDGGPYRLLTALGHTLIPPRPALTPLTAEKSAVKGLSGLRLPAILTLARIQKPARAEGALPLCQSQGEVLFTDYGISGVCAMELARSAQEEAGKTGVWPTVFIDFSPTLGLCPRRFFWRDENLSAPLDHAPAAEAWLADRQHILPIQGILQGALPRVLAERMGQNSIPQLARSLTAFPVPLTGVRGMEYAQVTAGGIQAEEFDGETMQSKIAPGLFAAGEMLDVDGGCGGFNLQFAFASGLIAGKQAAQTALRL